MPTLYSRVRDKSLKEALRVALDDRRISYEDTLYLIRATFDQGGITNKERQDLRRIMTHSRTMDARSKSVLTTFLRFVETRPRDTAGGSKLFEYLLQHAKGTTMLAANPEAHARVLAFMGRKGRGAWRHLTRHEIGVGLMINMRMPSLIHQGPSSLCGPSSLMFNLIKDNPVAYVQFAIDIYERGWAYLRRLRIVAGSDLKAYNPPRLRIAPVDWMTTAAIRDSENYLFDYESVDDTFSGITLPNHVARWFRNIGYTHVVNDTNLVLDKDAANARRAATKYLNGWRVCLFINSNMLHADSQTSSSATANHWVVLTWPMTLTTRSVRFGVFTWGQRHYLVPQGHTLCMDDFLDNYYGYVAAKY